MVMDARTGEVLHSRNADTRLHPASLTKMMTLYVAFEAVERGEISLDDRVTISRKAAAEPPSKLGLKSGQKIKLRFLIRAAAIKSANDAATAIGEAISGSEAAFARRMNRTAKAMGMTRTTFKNAHGLTEAGHLSTARDMTILGRHVFYDYPDYYNLFSRIQTSAGKKTVTNTNRRLLNAYRGSDGIKTGYTRAAGYNLVASAERGRERIIATVFGGRSTATRNARVAELLDMGFKRAPTQVAVRKPKRPAYLGNAASPVMVARAGPMGRSPLPKARPAAEEAPTAVAMASTLQSGIENALAEVVAEDVAEASIPAEDSEAPGPTPLLAPSADVAVARASLAAIQPLPRPVDMAETTPEPTEPTVVTRLSTSGGRHWGITIGSYPNRHDAERMLLTTALTELATLDEALRKVVPRGGEYDANFVGMTEDQASMACRRLAARDVDCSTFGPG
ncbi:MAG: D-alanyl-D-alanine carboxypeptidase family protein [Pseudomonadota bacterium]